MGFAASQARLLMLVARKSDLELQQQFLSQSRMRLANMTASMFQAQLNLEPGSPDARAMDARIAGIQALDKQLELQMNRISSQHEAVQTEIESVRKIISRNVQSSFKLFS